MVRIEQKLRASFGEGVIAYSQTQYYKDLRDSEKKRFKRHIETRDVKRKWKFFAFIAILGCIFFTGFEITGNAIASGGSSSMLDMVLISLFILIAIFFLINSTYKKKRWKKMEGHFSVIENIMIKRRLNKK